MKLLSFICLLVAAPNWTKSKNLPPNVNHDENGVEGVIGYNGNQLWKAFDTGNREESILLPKVFAKAPGHILTWDAYHRLDVIYEYLDFLEKTYPNLCKVKTIGYTHEGRPIQLLKISNGNPNNKAIWIEGGIHAREWITPATVTYIIEQFVSKFTSQSAAVQGTDWYVVPVLNPDGYEYSHTDSRIWRKNKRNNGLGDKCDGVDLNRNFGYKWKSEGATAGKCWEQYSGSAPFSEPETLAVKNFFENSTATWKAYLTFHSFAQQILYPWGYDDVLPSDHKDLQNVADRMAKAMKSVGGVSYQTGPTASTIFLATGLSHDWAKGAVGIKYSYTIELRATDYGFELPASYIVSEGRDGLAAVTVLAEV